MKKFDNFKALAKQAGITIDGMGYGEGNVEFFAELIVQECLKAIQTQSRNSGDEWEHGLQLAEYAIERQFGLEE